MQDLPLLLDLPTNRIRKILEEAGGNEIASGKFASPQSSAALAVNGFGWFLERPALLPAFPRLEASDWAPVQVDIERQMRFPWRGGRHPWLDAAVETRAMLIGVESKRYELVTEGRRKGKEPVLLYLFAEPPDAGSASAFTDHRAELRTLPVR